MRHANPLTSQKLCVSSLIVKTTSQRIAAGLLSTSHALSTLIRFRLKMQSPLD